MNQVDLWQHPRVHILITQDCLVQLGNNELPIFGVFCDIFTFFLRSQIPVVFYCNVLHGFCLLQLLYDTEFKLKREMKRFLKALFRYSVSCFLSFSSKHLFTFSDTPPKNMCSEFYVKNAFFQLTLQFCFARCTSKTMKHAFLHFKFW